jgi:hypothetical protein
MPLLAAGLGVLGGIAGAFIGGYLANEGAESRFESERAGAEQDLRRDTYGTYLGTAQELWAEYLADDGSDAAEDAIAAAGVRLFVAQARVRLVAENDEVEDAAKRLREILVDGEGEDYTESEHPELATDLEEATKAFLAVAQADIRG